MTAQSTGGRLGMGPISAELLAPFSLGRPAPVDIKRELSNMFGTQKGAVWNYLSRRPVSFHDPTKT
jgi:hypothetical protein